MHTQWEHQLIAMAGAAPQPSSARPLFSYWAGDATLQKAYNACASITAEHSRSFHFATAFLPEENRSAVRALYAFCRTVDDCVDEPGVADHQLNLDYWRMIVQTGSAPSQDLVAAAWADTLTRYYIPRHYALQLIDGVARDLIQTRYASFQDLSTYCYGVASTVGLMSMCIIGFKSHEAIPYAIKLGVALQLTNILRDVGEDFRNGRVYLPQNEMNAFGISDTDLETAQVTPRWRDFMRFQVDRTRKLYAESRPGIKMLERQGQLATGAASTLYGAILDAIESNDYDVFSRRASLSTWGKLSRVPALWWGQSVSR